MHRTRTTQRVGAHLREPDMADVSRSHELCNRSDRFLDRHLRVESTEPVDIDVVGAETGPRGTERGLERGRSAIEPQNPSVRPAQDAELDADHSVFAVPAAKRISQQKLVMT